MSLIQILQEASSLGLDSLKKAMLRDKNAKLIFSSDLTLDKIENKDAFLATIKYWLLNNENVKSFISSRHNIRDLDIESLAEYRKLRGNDLDKDKLEWLQKFIKDIFKEYSSVEKGSMPPELRKKLKEWMDTSGRYYNLPAWAQNELMSIPSLRPSKRILVYRGLLFSSESLKERQKYDGTLEIGNGLAFLRSIKKGTREIDLSWDRPSSWTKDKQTAEQFAKYGPASSMYSATLQWLEREMSKKSIDGAMGFIVSTFANPEDILIDTTLSGYLGSKHTDEAEVILRAGAYKARIVKKYTVEGEVDPVQSDMDMSASAELFDNIDKFVSKFELPEDHAAMSSLNDSGLYFDAAKILCYPDVFRKLILNSSTTSIIHAYDQLLEFYKSNLKDADEKLQPELFTNNPELGRKADKLREFKQFFEDKVKHSKFGTSKSNKKHELDGAEYRSIIADSDLRLIEQDLLKFGRMTDSSSGRAFENLAKCLNVKLPSSARINMFGAAKQEEYINEVITSFFKLIRIDKPDDSLEAKKIMINYIRKAFRNLFLLQQIENLKKLLESTQ